MFEIGVTHEKLDCFSFRCCTIHRRCRRPGTEKLIYLFAQSKSSFSNLCKYQLIAFSWHDSACESGVDLVVLSVWLDQGLIFVKCISRKVQPNEVICQTPGHRGHLPRFGRWAKRHHRRFEGLHQVEEQYLSRVHPDAQDDALHLYWPTALVAPQHLVRLRHPARLSAVADVICQADTLVVLLCSELSCFHPPCQILMEMKSSLWRLFTNFVDLHKYQIVESQRRPGTEKWIVSFAQSKLSCPTCVNTS